MAPLMWHLFEVYRLIKLLFFHKFLTVFYLFPNTFSSTTIINNYNRSLALRLHLRYAQTGLRSIRSFFSTIAQAAAILAFASLIKPLVQQRSHKMEYIPRCSAGSFKNRSSCELVSRLENLMKPIFRKPRQVLNYFHLHHLSCVWIQHLTYMQLKYKPSHTEPMCNLSEHPSRYVDCSGLEM